MEPEGYKYGDEKLVFLSGEEEAENKFLIEKNKTR